MESRRTSGRQGKLSRSAGISLTLKPCLLGSSPASARNCKPRGRCDWDPGSSPLSRRPWGPEQVFEKQRGRSVKWIKVRRLGDEGQSPAGDRSRRDLPLQGTCVGFLFLLTQQKPPSRRDWEDEQLPLTHLLLTISSAGQHCFLCPAA